MVCKKAQQLGMPFGTANNRLKKMILFHLLKVNCLNVCFRCKKEIEKVEYLSIEHKIAWLDNDVELFWDINNIAFSHLSCNISVARKPTKINYEHGKKWCWSCKQQKDLKYFPNNAKHNRARMCTSCETKYKSEYREKKNN